MPRAHLDDGAIRTAAATRLVTRATSEVTGSAPLSVQLLAGGNVPSLQRISNLQHHSYPLTGNITPMKSLETPTLNCLPRGLNTTPKGHGADLNQYLVRYHLTCSASQYVKPSAGRRRRESGSPPSASRCPQLLGTLLREHDPPPGPDPGPRRVMRSTARPLGGRPIPGHARGAARAGDTRDSGGGRGAAGGAAQAAAGWHRPAARSRFPLL